MSRSSAVHTLPDPRPSRPGEAASRPDARSFVATLAFQTDNLLRNREGVYGEIVESPDLTRLIGVSLAMTAVFGGLYGATMGLHGGATQALASAVKVPVLLSSSLFAVAPALYAFNTVLGSKIRPGQLAALAASTLATTSVLLLALAPVSLFLTFTGLSYAALKLLQVGLFFIAGYCGGYFLYEGVQTVSARLGKDQNLPLLQLWLFAYAFVGMHLAWMMRPFIGEAGRPFALVRPISGSFYNAMVESLVAVFR